MEKTIVQIVEDEAVLSNTLKDELEEEGFQVLQAFDGEEGLKMISENKPDIILLDIIMPKLNGTELLKLLKSNDDLKDIPVIVLTVHGNLEKISDTISLGAKAYFIKDQQGLPEIVDTVKNILHR